MSQYRTWLVLTQEKTGILLLVFISLSVRTVTFWQIHPSIKANSKCCLAHESLRNRMKYIIFYAWKHLKSAAMIFSKKLQSCVSQLRDMKDQLHQWHRSVVRRPWQCTVSVTLRKWYNLTLQFGVWHWCAFPLICHIINFHFKVSRRHTENLLLKIICEPWNHEIHTAGGCNILCSGGVWGFWKTFSADKRFHLQPFTRNWFQRVTRSYIIWSENQSRSS